MYVVGLGAFFTLDNVKLNRLAFFERLITVDRDRAVVSKDIWTAIMPKKAISVGVIEPLNRARVLRHMNSSRGRECALRDAVSVGDRAD